MPTPESLPPNTQGSFLVVSFSVFYTTYNGNESGAVAPHLPQEMRLRAPSSGERCLTTRCPDGQRAR